MHIICLRGGTNIRIHEVLQKLDCPSTIMGREDATSLANDGTKANKKCARCGYYNHKTANCYVKRHYDRTVLHTMGKIEEIEEIKESNEDVSSELSSDFNTCCDIELEDLMFIQPHIHSPEEKSRVCILRT